MYRLLRCSHSPGPGWANRVLRLVVLFCSRPVSRLGVMIRRYFFCTFCINIRSISLEDTAVKGLLANVPFAYDVNQMLGSRPPYPCHTHTTHQ